MAIAFGVAWGYWGFLAALGISGTDPKFQLFSLPAAFAPALGAGIVRRWVTHEGFDDGGAPLRLRQDWPYYLVAWLLPLGVTAVIVGLAIALQISQPDPTLQRFLQTVAPSVTPPAATNLLPLLIPSVLVQALVVATPIVWGEEFGWRGYLQRRLLVEHPRWAAIATGLIWGIWHYPLVVLGYEHYENQVVGGLVFTVFTVLLSIIFGWLQAQTGSLWIACLAHGATNAIGGSLTVTLFLGGPNWLWVGYNGILACLPLGLVSLWMWWQPTVSWHFERSPH